MNKNKEYAKQLMESEEYDRKIVAFKMTDTEPTGVESYGADVSFLCAIAAEAWDRDAPFYITNKNILCGGAVYGGLGSRKMDKDTFLGGMEATIGQNRAYSSFQVFRRVNQQYPHIYKHYKFMIVGALEDVQDPDIVMVVADAHKIMRLCKAYTWKTGELVHGLQGTAWCTEAFPIVFREKTMTYNLGDPPSRSLMQLEPSEMYCMIHYDLLPLVIENIENISSGEFY
jgi:uncharacterized protein (DUF169 family)